MGNKAGGPGESTPTPEPAALPPAALSELPAAATTLAATEASLSLSTATTKEITEPNDKTAKVTEATNKELAGEPPVGSSAGETMSKIITDFGDGSGSKNSSGTTKAKDSAGGESTCALSPGSAALTETPAPPSTLPADEVSSSSSTIAAKEIPEPNDSKSGQIKPEVATNPSRTDELGDTSANATTDNSSSIAKKYSGDNENNVDATKTPVNENESNEMAMNLDPVSQEKNTEENSADKHKVGSESTGNCESVAANENSATNASKLAENESKCGIKSNAKNDLETECDKSSSVTEGSAMAVSSATAVTADEAESEEPEEEQQKQAECSPIPAKVKLATAATTSTQTTSAMIEKDLASQDLNEEESKTEGSVSNESANKVKEGENFAGSEGTQENDQKQQSPNKEKSTESSKSPSPKRLASRVKQLNHSPRQSPRRSSRKPSTTPKSPQTVDLTNEDSSADGTKHDKNISSSKATLPSPSVASSTNSEETPVKRKRGRPRKTPPKTVPTNDNAESSTPVKKNSTDDVASASERRVRPRRTPSKEISEVSKKVEVENPDAPKQSKRDVPVNNSKEIEYTSSPVCNTNMDEPGNSATAKPSIETGQYKKDTSTGSPSTSDTASNVVDAANSVGEISKNIVREAPSDATREEKMEAVERPIRTNADKIASADVADGPSTPVTPKKCDLTLSKAESDALSHPAHDSKIPDETDKLNDGGSNYAESKVGDIGMKESSEFSATPEGKSLPLSALPQCTSITPRCQRKSFVYDVAFSPEYMAMKFVSDKRTSTAFPNSFDHGSPLLSMVSNGIDNVEEEEASGSVKDRDSGSTEESVERNGFWQCRCRNLVETFKKRCPRCSCWKPGAKGGIKVVSRDESQNKPVHYYVDENGSVVNTSWKCCGDVLPPDKVRCNHCLGWRGGKRWHKRTYEKDQPDSSKDGASETKHNNIEPPDKRLRRGVESFLDSDTSEARNNFVDFGFFETIGPKKDLPVETNRYCANSGSQGDKPDQSMDKFDVGTVVYVKERMWPGVNKAGGVARIRKVYEDSNSGSTKYDVAYVIGGREKGVEQCFVFPHDVDNPSNNEEESPKSNEFEETLTEEKSSDPQVGIASLKKVAGDGSSPSEAATDTTSKKEVGVTNTESDNMEQPTSDKVPQPSPETATISSNENNIKAEDPAVYPLQFNPENPEMTQEICAQAKETQSQPLLDSQNQAPYDGDGKYWSCFKCSSINVSTRRCSSCRHVPSRCHKRASSKVKFSLQSISKTIRSKRSVTYLLELTRHELLCGRDYWICTHCDIGIPSLLMPCGKCRRKISFVPLDRTEFEKFVRKQRVLKKDVSEWQAKEGKMDEKKGNTKNEEKSELRKEDMSANASDFRKDPKKETLNIDETINESREQRKDVPPQTPNKEQQFELHKKNPKNGHPLCKSIGCQKHTQSSCDGFCRAHFNSYTNSPQVISTPLEKNQFFNQQGTPIRGSGYQGINVTAPKPQSILYGGNIEPTDAKALRWSCDACTFFNPADDIKCNSCLKMRPSLSRSTPIKDILPTSNIAFEEQDSVNPNCAAVVNKVGSDDAGKNNVSPVPA